ncbi:hypothetical protein NQ318_005683 [Aromia moschata]|uniref:CCHC-type domain-containing protein n=1 Tax=Aromia moschata TaxID=1265417 RepID=A0AAV8X165_9CUCU|nr:hypothetical protein NQ318_005683 [Aromia moschata]
MSQELNKRRGTVKTKLTNFSKYLTAFQAKTKEEIKDIDFIELNDRLARAENLLDEFEEVQNLIERSCTDEISELVYQERESFENSYHSQIALAKNLLRENNFELDVKACTDRSSEKSPGSTRSQEVDNKLGLVKLPKISLPTFEGKSPEWLDFRDTYVSLIHNNVSLNDVQKFHYLRASLKGHADQIIKSSEFSANNYQSAWKCLTDRFDNPLCDKNHYIQKYPSFLNCTVLERSDKVKDLKLCINCLRGGHFSKVCRRSTCRKCYSKHHTLLHVDKNENSVKHSETKNELNYSSNTTNNDLASTPSNLTFSACGTVNSVFLSTAYASVLDRNGNDHTIRVLLDSGSQSI